MVNRFALLALATSALGNYVKPEWGNKPDTETTTMVTYTTTTVCPVTSTVTDKGTTYWKTDLTTSTLTITECHGCGGGVVTVPGPTVTGVTTKLIEVTYTSLCPVKETITGPESTYVTTKTVTSAIVTKVPTTYYESVPGPAKTATATDVKYSTITSLCPVTKVTTIAGEEKTITYTTTSLIKTVVPTTVEETTKLPDHTATATDVEYKTITTVCPVTKTTTIAGKEYTTTYKTTSIIKTAVPKTYEETVTQPDKWATATDVEYKTLTKVYPVTQVTTIEGKVHTTTYTTTKVVKTAVPVTVVKTSQKPDVTEIATKVEYSTYTKVYPVTQETTIEGKVHTQTYTTTKIIKTAIPVTVQSTVKKPDVTEVATDVEYKTVTKVYPVTQVTTIEGEERTITYKATKVIETQVPVTVQKTVEKPGAIQTATDVEYKTLTKVNAVTQVVTVNGQESTVKYTTTSYVKIHQVNTILTTLTKPGAIETKGEVVYVTKKKDEEVTATVEVPGPGKTEISKATSTVEEEKPSESESKAPEPTESQSQSYAPVPTAVSSTSAQASVPTAAAQTNSVPVVALVAGVAAIMAVL
ncbi:hypothetical protein XA68_16852 [Ophiocordyceps unilateralis]|uniref:Repetitive proline-rich cell wall protein n=1 Tax=Ophiocordyceps unilateralis TaxID=268505 RepID=A0A2A9P4Y2_OPHUN|nr:hypothetical protein XA68_16852 [Ophiocordyceps unilateralis]